MELLRESKEVKEAEKIKERFRDQIAKLKKLNTEDIFFDAYNYEMQSRRLRNLMEINLPASGIVLDKLIEKDKKYPLLHLEWMSHRVHVTMSSESFSKAKRIAEEARSIARDIFTSSQHDYVDAQTPELSAYKAYLRACIDMLTVCKFQGKLADAETYLNEAKTIAIKEGNVDDQHHLCILEGDLFLARGQLNNAIENFFSPLLRTQNLTNYNRGLLLQKLGNACRSAALLGLAKDYLRESIRMAAELENETSEFERTADLGNVYRSEGRIADALKLQISHMAFAFKRGDLWGFTIGCFNLGLAYFSLTPQPELGRALTLFIVKYDLTVQMESDLLRGTAFNILGRVFCALRQYEIALKLMTESVQVAQKTLNVAGEGMAYGYIGTAYRFLGKFEEAILNHNKYLENAIGRGDNGGAAIMQRELAIDYICKGDLKNAEKLVRKAIFTLETIRNKIGSEDTSKIANFDKNQAETYSLLQVILVRQGKYSEALALSELARSRALTDLIREKHIKNSVVESSSWIYSSDFLHRWQDFVKQLLSDYKAMADSLKTNFVVYSVLKDYDANAIGHRWLYIWVVLNEEASEGGERIRFRRQILDRVGDEELSTASDFFSNLDSFFRYYSNNEHLDARKEQMKEDNTEGKSTVKLQDSPAMKESLEFLKLFPLLEIPKDRGQNGDRTTQCRNVEHSVEDASQNENDRNGQSEDQQRAKPVWKKYMYGSWNKEGVKQLLLLYRLCIAPIDDCVPRSTEEYVPRITIIPHEFLFRVPFCCLHDEKQKYLIERFILNYAPSFRAFCLLNHRFRHLKRRQGQRKLKVLAIGNPKAAFLVPLPGSGEEAKNVQEVFGPEQCQLVLDNNASKKLLLNELAKIDVLHIATHAVQVDPEDTDESLHGDYSMQGCLLLASSGDECEGIVNASDIASEDCSCQLVTLSCCETGLGKLTGDGVVGLYRAFLAAGAASVLVTLWKIRDDCTITFMERFYAELKGMKNVSESLRSAMLFLIRENKLPPKQWAPFSFVGADV